METIPTPRTPEELAKALTEIRADVQHAKGLHDRLTIAEKASAEIREIVQGIRTAQQMEGERARASVHASDAEIVRSFVVSEDAAKREAVSKSLAGVSYGSDQRGPVGIYATASGAVRMLGTEDEGGDWVPGLLDDPNPKSDWHRELQSRANDLGLYRMVPGAHRSPPRKLVARVMSQLRKGPEEIRRVFADNTGEGGEFIPDVTLPNVFSLLRTPAQLASKFTRTQLPTGGTTANPFYTGGCQPFIIGVPTSGDMNPAEMVKSVPGTATVSTSPVTWGVALPANRDASEDSIIEWGGFASMSLANALADGEEDALINGDTNGGDTGLAAWAGPNSRWATLGHSSDHRKSWIGLRHRAIDISAAADQSGAQTLVGVMAWRAGLSGAYRGSVSDLMYIMPLGFTIAKLLVDTNFLTLDKAGAFATNFTGAIGFIGGIPVYLSDFMTEDLNASGVFDNVTLDYTGGLLVNHPRFQFAERRGARVEVDVQPLRHTAYHIASIRETFRTVDQSTTKNVYYGYKLAKS